MRKNIILIKNPLILQIIINFEKNYPNWKLVTKFSCEKYFKFQNTNEATQITIQSAKVPFHI